MSTKMLEALSAHLEERQVVFVDVKLVVAHHSFDFLETNLWGLRMGTLSIKQTRKISLE